jgi:NAD(P)-dependent dehydrogenase (short-subunit alcohol dehydrogenase family)
MTGDSKVYIVTGAARGIGRAITQRFVRDGHRVLAVDLNEADLIDLRLSVQTPDSVSISVQNVAEPSAAKAAIDSAHRHFERIDGLVNNAGIAGAKRVDETEDEDFDLFADVMMRATFRYSREFVRYLNGRGGAIVNISSAFALVGSPGGSAYAAVKAAVIGLTRQMAVDYGPQGLRTNAIAPGLIATPMTQGRINGNERFRRMMIDTTPSPRIGRPEDIANSVAFLCSDDAEFINGHLLAVDGGWTVTNYIRAD